MRGKRRKGSFSHWSCCWLLRFAFVFMIISKMTTQQVLPCPPLLPPPVVHSKSSNKWNVFLFFFPNIEYWSGLLKTTLLPLWAPTTRYSREHLSTRRSNSCWRLSFWHSILLSPSLSLHFSLHLPLLAFFSFCFSSLGCVCDLIYALLSVSLIVFAHKYGRAARKYLSICEIQSKPFCLCLCCCCSCFA